MNRKSNSKFESTRIKVPRASNTSVDEEAVDSVGLDLENSLRMDDREEPTGHPESVEMKHKFGALNSKLSSYVATMKNTENRLAESLQKCKLLEEANSSLKENFQKQLEFLRSELDEQIQKTVLAEEKRSHSEQQLESCSKQLEQVSSERETYRRRAEELEENLKTEGRRSEEVLGELGSLREQMLRERADCDDLKQQMTELKVDHAKLQERLKINSLELSFSQSKLGELQNQKQFTAVEVQQKLAKMKQQLEKRHNERIAEKLREKQIEIEFIDKRHQETLKEIQQKSISAEDFELLKTQLDEQKRRADSAEHEAADWRLKYQETESKLERLKNDYAKQLDKERRRRKELNGRLLAQSRAQDEVRQELETYRKLIEGLDQGAGSFTECLSMTTPEGSVDSSLSPGSPSGRRRLFQRALDSPEARTRLLRKALTPRKRSLSREGNTASLIQVLNKGRHHET